MAGRRFSRVWILAALLALLVMSGCVAAGTGGAADMPAGDMDEMAGEGYPDEMIIGMGALPVTLVGNTVPSLQSRIFSKLLYETLAELNEETGAIDPVLLDSMELVDDVTVRIVITEGIEFHNGEKLTAPRAGEELRAAACGGAAEVHLVLPPAERFRVVRGDRRLHDGVHPDRADRSLGEPVCEPHAAGAGPPGGGRAGRLYRGAGRHGPVQVLVVAAGQLHYAGALGGAPLRACR